MVVDKQQYQERQEAAARRGAIITALIVAAIAIGIYTFTIFVNV